MIALIKRLSFMLVGSEPLLLLFLHFQPILSLQRRGSAWASWTGSAARLPIGWESTCSSEAAPVAPAAFGSSSSCLCWTELVSCPSCSVFSSGCLDVWNSADLDCFIFLCCEYSPVLAKKKMGAGRHVGGLSSQPDDHFWTSWSSIVADGQEPSIVVARQQRVVQLSFLLHHSLRCWTN